MNMETKLMENIVAKASMNGGAEDGLLIFEKNGLRLQSASFDKTTFFDGIIDKKIINDYKINKEFCIKDLTIFKKYVNRMGKHVDFIIDDNNTIVFSNDIKVITSKVADKSLIDEFPELDLTYNFKTVISTATIRDIIRDTCIFGSDKNGSVITITVNGDVMTLETGNNDDTIKHTIKLDNTATEKITIRFGTPLLERVINTLTESKITVNLKTEYPIKIEEAGEETNNMWVIAPRVD